MEQIILQPKENYNPNKLSTEMYDAGIECWISIGEQEYILEYQNTTMESLQAILDIHDPTPQPDRPSQEELNAQAIEEIIAMLMKE
ncbi:hypothetical protein [Eubacterium maltosivorans]|uniref:hypothetical protein n=1 Tax=Eubacterium maltosivorans TaxID=2041044 RepID=UPI00189E15E5|nr:hypothetical protein [Eubacterium maltosivorans]